MRKGHGPVTGGLWAPPANIRFSQDGTDASGGAPATGGESNGAQPAVTAEHLQKLEADLSDRFNGMLTTRFGRLESTLREAMGGTAEEPAPKPASKGSGGSGSQQQDQSSDRLQQLEAAFQQSQQALAQERASGRLREALSAHGIDGNYLRDAVQILAPQLQQDNMGNFVRVGQGEHGQEVRATVEQVVGEFLKERPRYVPAPHQGGSGAGAAGTKQPTSGEQPAPTTLSGLTAEQIRDLDAATRRQCAANDLASSKNRSGPWGSR